MISTKYSDKIANLNRNILIDAIQHEKKTGIFDDKEPVKNKITLSEAINSLPSSRSVLVAKPNVGQNILKAKKGGGKSAVLYKKQVPVIGGNNVDFK